MIKIDPAIWPALSTLLDEYLDQPEESRAAWLERLGPDYADVLPTLRELLRRQTENDEFLRTLPSLTTPDTTRVRMDAQFSAPGAIVGPYKLNRELGRGGMGEVWLAERADGSLKRPVALKLPIVSLRNRAFADRFGRERDILAQLTHPQIARLYDAGVTADGQSYLAMEYVEGEPVTDYCDGKRLELKHRLKLFLDVLRAVQYAHTNLIVHRDLKPSNILVNREGHVRLLDFGIAKLLVEGEAYETELTQAGGRVLTPEYASPEQLAGRAVSTASDVYALGVVLYELLTGESPHIRHGRVRAMEPETDVSRPSQAVRDEGRSQARALSTKGLSAALKGDLDTIVMRALSNQPADRYPTADAFAQDIERYLTGQPVLARPESRWYRARKFILRNKLVVGASILIAASLVVGLVATGWEARVATMERGRADAKAQESERHRRQAEAETRRAQEQGRIALQEQQRAEEQRREAEAQRDSNRRLLYIAEMNLADQSWQSNAVRRTEQVLLKYVPKPGEEDLRGLEWYYLWRLSHTERALLRFPSSTTGVAFSPDGRLLAVSHSGKVTLLDLFEAQVVGMLPSETGIFADLPYGRSPGLAFTPDSRLLAGTEGQTIRLWDVQARRNVGSWPVHNVYGSITFSQDSEKLSFSDKVLDTSSGRELFALPSRGRFAIAALSPDGTRLAVYDPPPQELKIIALPGGREVLTIKGYNSQIQDLQFSTDGRILASAGYDRTVRLWDTATGAESKILQGHSQPLKHARFSPDGQLLATTADGGTAKLWQVSTGEELATLHVREGPGGVAFSPDGRLLAWAADDGIHVWDVRTVNGVLKGHWAEPSGSGLAFSPDGNVLFAATVRSGIRLWDVRAGGELPGITSGCFELSLSADGRRLATVAGNLDITVWELPDWQKRLTLRPSGTTKSVALSPDGRTLLAGQANGMLRVWNAITGQEVRTIQVHPDRTSPRAPGGPYGINRVVFSPDGTRFATVGVDGTAIVWDRATLHQLMILREPTPWLTAAAFDHAGRFLATGGGPDRSAKIWDLATGRELATLSGHGGYVTVVAFSPDGSRLLTGSSDTTVRMWQVPSGQEIMTLRGHSTGVHAIAFSSKGDVFATADGEGVVRLWSVATPQTVLAQLSDPGLRAGLESIRAAMRAPAVEPR